MINDVKGFKKSLEKKLCFLLKKKACILIIDHLRYAVNR